MTKRQQGVRASPSMQRSKVVETSIFWAYIRHRYFYRSCKHLASLTMSSIWKIGFRQLQEDDIFYRKET